MDELYMGTEERQTELETELDALRDEPVGPTEAVSDAPSAEDGMDPESTAAGSHQSGTERQKERRSRPAPVVSIDDRLGVETDADKARDAMLDLVESLKTRRILSGTVQGIERPGDGTNSVAVIYHGTSRCSSLQRRWSRSLVFCFSLLGTLPAFAATTVQAYMVNYPRQTDPNYGNSSFGHSANYLMSGWAYVAYERMTLHAIGSYNGQIAYCIEPGVDQDSGDTLTSTDESYWDNYPASSNVTIPPETIKTLLGRVLTYGYHGNISQDWMTGNASDADSLSYAIATQMLVWEVVVGERDANFDHVDPSAYGKGAVMDYCRQVIDASRTMLASYKGREAS